MNHSTNYELIRLLANSTPSNLIFLCNRVHPLIIGMMIKFPTFYPSLNHLKLFLKTIKNQTISLKNYVPKIVR